MGDKATLRMARQELEDLYLGVPDDSVDLTFKDLASSPFPAAATSSSTNLPNDAVAVDVDEERKKKQTAGLARSSTNIFTYIPLEDHEDTDGTLGGGGGLLQLPPSPAAPPPHKSIRQDDDGDHQYHRAPAAAVAITTGNTTSRAAVAGETAGSRRSPRSIVAGGDDAGGRERRASHNNNYKRPGIPHSNICTLCNNYVYLFRHRCLVCGRVYCRRCVGAGMGDMTEGRKCIDCLGRRYSHRYIRRAGDTGCCLCFWGYYPNAKVVTAQELIWAEKGPAPRRRPRPTGSSSISTSYGGGDGGYDSRTNTIASASMSMTMNSDSSMATMKMNGLAGNSTSGMPASASSSFVASFAPNPHAFPL